MERNARYLDISRDIGQKIVEGQYKKGDILHGRSKLASEYNVSPETIRKTMNILSKENVVSVKHGVGIFVNEAENAVIFMNKIGKNDTIKKTENRVKELLDGRKKIDEQLNTEILKLIDSYRFFKRQTIDLLDLIIPSGSWIIDHSIGDIYFYNYTESTIVAVIRDDVTYTSPGPDFVLKSNDNLILVAKDHLSYERAQAYILFGAGED